MQLLDYLFIHSDTGYCANRRCAVDIAIAVMPAFIYVGFQQPYQKIFFATLAIFSSTAFLNPAISAVACA